MLGLRRAFSRALFLSSTASGPNPSTSTQIIKKRDINHNAKGSQIVSHITKQKKSLWDMYNQVVYPPRDPLVHGPECQRRPAEITHKTEVVMGSRKRFILLAEKIQGLSVSEAMLQLSYQELSAARVLEELIIEAVELAVRDHNVEFRTRLFIETLRVGRGPAVPVIRKGLRSDLRRKNYHFANVYLRLREFDSSTERMVYHPNRLPNAWTPRFNCPPEGSRGWGSTHDMKMKELERIRKLRIKGEA